MSSRGRVLERGEVVVDPRDEDDCVAILRAWAKRHKVRLSDLELRVYKRPYGERRYRVA